MRRVHVRSGVRGGKRQDEVRHQNAWLRRGPGLCSTPWRDTTPRAVVLGGLAALEGGLEDLAALEGAPGVLVALAALAALAGLGVLVGALGVLVVLREGWCRGLQEDGSFQHARVPRGLVVHAPPVSHTPSSVSLGGAVRVCRSSSVSSLFWSLPTTTREAKRCAPTRGVHHASDVSLLRWFHAFAPARTLSCSLD